MEPSFATVCGSPKIDCWPYYRYTTNRLILGRDINFPAHLMFPLAAIRLTDVEDYVARCTGSIQKAHDFASNTLKTSLRRMKRDTRKTYDEGGLVCLLCAAGVKRQMYRTIPTLEGTGHYNEKDLCIPLKSKVEKIRFQQ